MSKFCMSCMEQYEDEFEVCPHCGYVEGAGENDALHIVPSSILHDRYIVGKSVGFGGFGVTYIGYDALLEQKVAIKEYMPSEFSTRAMGEMGITVFGGKKEEQFQEGLSKFLDEAKKLAKFNYDDGIVKVYDTFEENNTAYIIMEYLEGETLAQYLERKKTVPLDQAINLILPIAESLKSVHEAGIIHRDIAPDNIFLTKDGKVKLIDFGAARFATTSHSRSLTVLIKPGYSPEEQYRSRGDQGPYTDTYALGAVLYRMITGVTPPDALERRAFFENKKKDILVPITKYCKDIPENKQNAILNAMNVRIEDRTQNTEEFIHELTTDEMVARRKGKIQPLKFYTWPLWAKISIPSLGVLVLTLCILLATGVIGFKNDIQKNIYVPDGMSRVPSIVNTALPDAEERLNAAVLLYSIIGKEYSNEIPADMILTQSVDGGSVVAENTIIDLVISGGAQTAEVPNVEGLYIDEAAATLENLGFLVHTETEYSGTVAEGGVISQSVKALEEHPIGETIVLTVSLGRDPDEEYVETLVAVPDFVGKTYDEALKLAQDAGLMVLAKEKAYSAEYEKDVVMHQSVEVGTQIISGNAVELTISLGIQIIKVPDVQFLTETEAITLIENSGLVASITYETSETVKAGLVISQTPAAGTETDPGAKVAIVVSKGAASFAMPNVVGMSENDARSVLLAKGISVTVNYKYSTASDLGKVLEQSVAADTPVYAGSTMIITVSTGKELFAVPNVVGLSETDAKKAITKIGFAVKVNSEYNETVPEGSVIYQTPDAGSQQSLSTNILIVVSKGKKPIEVPNVEKMEQSKAESTLSSYGFKCAIQTAYSETVATGAVISQNPESGATAYSGDTITLVISKGREPIAIPNVVGMSESNAISAVESAGFVASVQTEYHDTVAEGKVYDQNPSYGTTAYRNSVVKIYVSKGKAPVPPTGVTLNISSKTLYPSGNDTTVQLTATVKPSDATDKSVTWSSSNTSVAQVSSTGFVTAVSAGTATITVKTNTGGYTATCKITVETVAVSSIAIKTPPTKTSYFVGDTLNTSGLSLTAYYNNGTTKTISSGFTCSPSSFSEIGEKNVTVIYDNKTAGMFAVDVIQPTEYYTYDIDVGETISFAFMAVYESYITVSSSNSNVAIATKSSIKGVSAGKAEITYRIVMNGKTYATSIVTVNVKQNTILVTSFTINRTDASNDRIDMTVGSTYQLNPTVYPENATNKTINWTSSDTNVATVDSNGVIHAHYAGWTTLTGTAADGSGVTKTTRISVEFLSEVESPGTTINMKVGESVYVTWKVRGMESSSNFQPITNSANLSNGNSDAVEWDRSDFKTEQIEYDGKYYTYLITFKLDANETGSTRWGCYSSNSTCEWVTIHVT